MAKADKHILFWYPVSVALMLGLWALDTGVTYGFGAIAGQLDGWIVAICVLGAIGPAAFLAMLTYSSPLREDQPGSSAAPRSRSPVPYADRDLS